MARKSQSTGFSEPKSRYRVGAAGADTAGSDIAGDRLLRRLRKIAREAAALAKQTGYMSDELIAERRADAVKDEEECQRELRDRKKPR